MPRGRKRPIERIEVTDQVGKRHVVVKYTERLYLPDDEERPPREGEVMTEYRLISGQIVEKTGPDTFCTADGKLRLKPLVDPLA